MKLKVLFLLLSLVISFCTMPSTVLGDYTVEGRTCPDDKPVNLPIGCYTNQEYIDQFQGGLATICVKNTINSSRYRSELPEGAYYKVYVARLTGSSGYVGLISNGGIELDNPDDHCPPPYYNDYNNGYNNGYNNNYNNGFNNGYNNGYNNGFNNGYNNGYNNNFNNDYNNGYIA